MIKFLSMAMLTVTMLFAAPKAHAYWMHVHGTAMTPYGPVTYDGWLQDGGIHGIINSNVGTWTWDVVHPHPNPISLETYADFSGFIQNNTATSGDYSNQNLFLAEYNDFATQIDNNNYTLVNDPGL